MRPCICPPPLRWMHARPDWSSLRCCRPPRCVVQPLVCTAAANQRPRRLRAENLKGAADGPREERVIMTTAQSPPPPPAFLFPPRSMGALASPRHCRAANPHTNPDKPRGPERGSIPCWGVGVSGRRSRLPNTGWLDTGDLKTRARAISRTRPIRTWELIKPLSHNNKGPRGVPYGFRTGGVLRRPLGMGTGRGRYRPLSMTSAGGTSAS